MQAMEQFGFYSVGSFKTFSLLEAVETSKRLNIPYQWHFNDEVYSQFDWSIEPTTSLWDLYTARAKQLRSKYDYLVLLFSGGADSTNILEVFLRNNIKLDEIISHTNFKATHDPMDRGNKETVLASIPFLEKRRLEFPELQNVKYSNIDLCDPIIKFFNIKEVQSNYIYLQNHVSTPYAVARCMTRDVYPFWRNLAETGKKVCFIWGVEKPRFKVVNNVDLHGQFWSTMDACVPIYSQMYPNPLDYNEFFYQTPDFPLIPIKQAHIVKNFINNPTGGNISYGSDKWGWNSLRFIDAGIPRSLTNEVLNQLIYPYWDPTTYSNGKRYSPSRSGSDNWFFYSNSDEVKVFEKMFNEATQIYTPDMCRPDFTGDTTDRNFKFGLLPSVSRTYYVGQISNQGSF